MKTRKTSVESDNRSGGTLQKVRLQKVLENFLYLNALSLKLLLLNYS